MLTLIAAAEGVAAGGLLAILIKILIICIIIGVIWYCLTLVPMPPPLGQVVRIILILIAVLLILALLLPLLGVAL